MTTDRETEIADLLVEHRVKHDSTGGYRGILGGYNVNCICGWHGVDHGDRPDVFDAHVASVLAAYITDREAAAWDAGQRAGFRYYREHVTFSERDRNPFRFTPDTEGEAGE